jgi:hypothetical protein
VEAASVRELKPVTKKPGVFVKVGVGQAALKGNKIISQLKSKKSSLKSLKKVSMAIKVFLIEFCAIFAPVFG